MKGYVEDLAEGLFERTADAVVSSADGDDGTTMGLSLRVVSLHSLLSYWEELCGIARREHLGDGHKNTPLGQALRDSRHN